MISDEVLPPARGPRVARPTIWLYSTSDFVGRAMTAALVTDFFRRLPVFKRPVEVRVIDDLPRGVTGVVRRAELRRLLEREARDD